MITDPVHRSDVNRSDVNRSDVHRSAVLRHVARRATLGRSLGLLRSFPQEQSDPDAFYSGLARDTVELVADLWEGAGGGSGAGGEAGVGGEAGAGEIMEWAQHQNVNLTPPFMVQLYSSYW